MEIANDYEFDHVAYLDINADENGRHLAKEHSYKFVGEGTARPFPFASIHFSYYVCVSLQYELEEMMLEMPCRDSFWSFPIFLVFGINIHWVPGWVMVSLIRRSKMLSGLSRLLQ